VADLVLVRCIAGPMNGRFPIDVFLIIFLPICAIAIYVFFAPLLVAQHVHHQLAVFVAVGFAAIGCSAH